MISLNRNIIRDVSWSLCNSFRNPPFVCSFKDISFNWINNQKAIAVADVKNQVANLSIEIAEKVLRKQFEDSKKQDELVKELLKEVKLS